jgi:hypothetical protein
LGELPVTWENFRQHGKVSGKKGKTYIKVKRIFFMKIIGIETSLFFTVFVPALYRRGFVMSGIKKVVNQNIAIYRGSLPPPPPSTHIL